MAASPRSHSTQGTKKKIMVPFVLGSKVKKIIVSKTDTCAMFWKKNDELFYDVIPVDAMIKGTHIHTTHSF
ncbi:hypothetical protein F2P81_005305 [Scophthalmus maximus]|uniref:Uncharacterized protein n=1 Tax=Scophthalmus maximus TaxID=52904 RepID=A0A6A4T6W5_SCOMX|nr:hypothetical protein F2P81_005305 [Scophthalmus maximus]